MPQRTKAARPSHAVLILDMLSEFEFPGGSRLASSALRIAPPLARLAARARMQHVPVIYVNDTARKWESDRRDFLDRCLRGKGAAIAERLMPESADYFIFKPKHSAFYATPLAELLSMLHVNHVVLTGLSSHQCVLLTACDAHMREIGIAVATDCIAAARLADTRHATYILQHGLGASLCPSSRLRF
jgi:nicotinamidase-related amidase